MAITYNQKVAILDKLTNEVGNQKAVVLITTKDAEESLPAKLNVDFRKKAREHGVSVTVVKNTLIRKAFETVPELVGPTYVAYLVDGENSDEVTVPKVVVDLINKDFKTNFNIVGSVVNKEYLDAKRTIVLSSVPSKKEESLAKIAGALNQLATKIAIGIKEVPTGLVRGVSEYSKTL